MPSSALTRTRLYLDNCYVSVEFHDMSARPLHVHVQHTAV